jgi:hypothetical protein
MGKMQEDNPKEEYSHPQSKQNPEPANGSKDDSNYPMASLPSSLSRGNL